MTRELLKTFVGTWALGEVTTGAAVARSCDEYETLTGFCRLLASRPRAELELAVERRAFDDVLAGQLRLPTGRLSVYASNSDPAPMVDGFISENVYFRARVIAGLIVLEIDGTPPDHTGEPVTVLECRFAPVRPARARPTVRRSAPGRPSVASSSRPRQVHDLDPEGHRQCPICSGLGQIDCASCGGMGGRDESQVEYDYDNNPTYRTVRVPCGFCAGGRTACTTCHGSGSVSR